jgi:catabolite regulation protein CreA
MGGSSIPDLKNAGTAAFDAFSHAAGFCLQVGHVDLKAGCVIQDGAEVLTKFGKTFITRFMPVDQMYDDCLTG